MRKNVHFFQCKLYTIIQTITSTIAEADIRLAKEIGTMIRKLPTVSAENQLSSLLSAMFSSPVVNEKKQVSDTFYKQSITTGTEALPINIANWSSSVLAIDIDANVVFVMLSVLLDAKVFNLMFKNTA